MWKLSALLAAHPRCPVCDFADRLPCTEAPMPPSPYTKTLAEAVGMTAEALLAELPL